MRQIVTQQGGWQVLLGQLGPACRLRGDGAAGEPLGHRPAEDERGAVWRLTASEVRLPPGTAPHPPR